MSQKYPIDNANEFLLDVALGNTSDGFLLKQAGSLQAVGGADFETLWGAGAALGNLVYLSSPERVKVFSDSANDAVGGGGATTVWIDGVAADGTRGVEAVTLTGLSTALTVKTFAFVNQVVVIAGEQDFANEGNISLKSEITDEFMSYIPAGCGVSDNAFFRVPLEHNACILDVILATSKNDEVSVIPYIRMDKDSPFVAATQLQISDTTSQFVDILKGLPGGADVQVRAKGITPNPDILLEFSLYIERKDNIKPIT